MTTIGDIYPDICPGRDGLLAMLDHPCMDNNRNDWIRAAVAYALLENGLVPSATFLAAMKYPSMGSPGRVKAYYAVWKAAMSNGIASHVHPDRPMPTLPKDDIGEFWRTTEFAKAQARKAENRKAKRASEDARILRRRRAVV